MVAIIIFCLNRKKIPIDLVTMILKHYGYIPVTIIKKDPKFSIIYQQALHSINRINLLELDRDEVKLRVSMITEQYYDNLEFLSIKICPIICRLKHWYYGTLWQWSIINITSINTCPSCYILNNKMAFSPN